MLKDVIKRLIKVGDFLDEPQVANRDEQPRQRSPKIIKEVLTIIGELHGQGKVAVHVIGTSKKQET